MAEERRKIDDDRIMVAVLEHTNQCAVNDMKVQHDRMYKELFNGDDGEHGFIAEGRNFFTAWYTRAKDEDANRSRRKWRIGTVIVLLGIFLAPAIQSGWETIRALDSLALKTPKIIRMVEDWEEFDTAPHPMDPPPVVTPPKAQTEPHKKQQKSFFYQPRGGVGLMQAPTQLSIIPQ